MKKFEIEKGIPPPSRVPRNTKYPFKTMEVGDSIEVKNREEFTMAANAANSYGRYNGKSFIRRRTADGGRIWRIA